MSAVSMSPYTITQHNKFLHYDSPHNQTHDHKILMQENSSDDMGSSDDMVPADHIIATH